MKIGLSPVVCWFSRDDASYEDSLTDILRRFSRDAKRLSYLGLSECDPTSLLTQALWSLQHKILDQYIPELKADKVRAVGCVWPWWEEIVVALPEGRLDTLGPLPGSDEQDSTK